MFISINRLQRCVQIWRLLCDQIIILETMTPLDFMEFRSYLSPASGFQSLQFRLIENKLGLTEKSRVVYNQISYKNAFPGSNEQTDLTNSLEEPTLLMLIEVNDFFSVRSSEVMKCSFLALARTNAWPGRSEFQFLGTIQTSRGAVH
jgi:tryptophan 2,3-dioxygenase